jgi:tricorn protease-like protein
VATIGNVSPDGRFIVFTYPESPDPFAPPNRLAVIPFEGGPIVRTFEMFASGTVATIVQWSADGKSLLYSVNANNVSNIWSQPVEGGKPKQITDFNDMLITGFAWTRDGKQLACTRGALLRDAILVTDLK